MDTANIVTAQNVVVRQEVASVGDRMLAYLIDLLILVAWLLLWGWIFSEAGIPHRAEPYLYAILFVFPLLFYHLVSELAMNGQSIGKRARHIKVARMDGGQPGLGQYLLRWVLRPIDIYFYAVGLLVMLFNGKGQRIGDLAAGTTVISLKRRLRLEDMLMTRVGEGHRVRFSEAIRLNDAQAALIKEVVAGSRKNGQERLAEEMAVKVRTVIGNDGGGMRPLEFLQIVLDDYVHLTGQQGEGTGHFRGGRPANP